MKGDGIRYYRVYEGGTVSGTIEFMKGTVSGTLEFMKRDGIRYVL